jgi:hypothetical protein
VASIFSGDEGSLQQGFAEVLENAGLHVLGVRRRPRGSIEYDLFDSHRQTRLAITVQLSQLRRLPAGFVLAAFLRAPALGREALPTSALLAYAPDLDLYVGWTPPAVVPSPLPVAMTAPERSLIDAQASGFARLPAARFPPSRAGAAFRPERVADFLRLVEPELPAQAEEPPSAAKRPPPAGAPEAFLEVERPANVEDHVEAEQHDEPPARRSRPLRGATGTFAPAIPPAEPSATAETPTVATGFADVQAPETPLEPDVALAPGQAYYFWFEVGVDVTGSIEQRPTALPDLPAGQRLWVQLFSFPDELTLGPDSRGELTLDAQRGASVTRKAASAAVPLDMLQRRLFFEVRTPDRVGITRLRCNIYLGSTLVQSRLVSIDVGERSHPGLPGLRSSLDYAMSETLALDALARLPAHELSLFVNGDATSHQFRFFSEGSTEPIANEASLDSMALDTAISRARAALKHASWGERTDWRPCLPYRYGSPDRARLETDLTDLAREGRQLYAGIASELVGEQSKLAQIALRTGRVQIATLAKGLYVPAGLFYDHVLEVEPAQGESYRLCPDFLAALDAAEPLEALTCFTSGCEHADEPYTVCASGFWGYRHEVGWPTGVEKDPDPTIRCGQTPELAIGVSTDPAFTLRAEHARRVAALGDASIAERRAELTPLLARSPHVVYFFCHGGITEEGTPFLEIGPEGEQGITAVYLINEKIRWLDRRPLVFINGCHTTALEPKQILDLVSAFVGKSNAVGVVGTELMVFQELGCAFAETMLEAFVSGSTVGASVRRARLALLKDCNPLGLVYVPFVAADTRLVREGVPTG